MAVSRTGEKVITASHDKSIRVWDVTDDLIFLEEEREKELEEMYESTLANQLDKDYADADEEGRESEVAAASKQTIATLTYGERIMEAMEHGYADYQLVQQWKAEKAHRPNLAPPQRNPLFMALGNISAEQHVLNTIRKVPSAALQDALLVIPFTSLPVLFTFVSVFLQRMMQPELAWRVFYFLLQTHNAQIIASRQLKEVLGTVLEAYGNWVKDEKRVMGFNMAALSLVGRDIRDAQVQTVGDEVQQQQQDENAERGTKKRAFASIA